MPAFISDDEFAVIKTTGDVTTMANKADAFIQTLYAEIETVKAKADAASITAEQTCSVLEQKFISLSSEFSALQSRNAELDSSFQERSSELAKVQSEKHQLYLNCIEKDGEIERLKTEVSELQKSKRQLLELIGGKDTEIRENNSTIKSYLDKISDMTDRAAQREARVSEVEAELLRCKAQCEKSLQEKELFEKHNAWLNAELTSKVDSFLEQRRKSAELEAEMSSKLADIEKQYNECTNSLNWHKETVRELESKLESLQRELCSARDEASASEQRYTVEISTVSKLVDLYKESSEEWSRKAGELEGVIKALETRLSQAESDYKGNLEKEAAARKGAELETSKLTEKVSKLEAELESGRKANELDILPLSSFTTKALTVTAGTNDLAVFPHVPAGVSGTALAASLLREGWSLAKMYAKYQEAADALQHEQMGRKQTEAILERVLFEIEEKAAVFLDERAEHERMADSYALINQKLQQSLSEQGNLEKVIQDLKAEIKKCEREYDYAQREIKDLQKQVTILLKECRDIQLRCGSVNEDYMDDIVAAPLAEYHDESDAQKIISEHLISVKDIKGLVEQNAKLRSLVRSLSDEVENREIQVKEEFGKELHKHKEEAASRVAAVLERAEEQGRMIESLHSSVSMYKRLYEEENRLRSSQSQTTIAPSNDGRKDFMLLLEGSQEASKKVHEQANERVRHLEYELASQKTEMISLRSERDKLALEANFAQDKLERFMKEFNHQREESNKILMRNIEFSQIIVDYQKKLRENSESVHSAEELSRKLNVELSVLKREKELLLNSEKRAHDEVQDLSRRVYRLQASLETVQSAEQGQEEARAEERRKQEEYIKRIEREWAEAKNELQEERNNVRTLSLDRENTAKDAMRQIEEMGKRLEAALQAVTLAEARHSDLERKLKSAESKIDGKDSGPNLPVSDSGAIGDLTILNQEIERLKLEALASKDHMLQYKSIAQVNEAALKQMEAAHESFKIEAEQFKKSLESEIQSLRDRVLELENEISLKSEEVACVASQKDEALATALTEITALKEETSNKVAQFMAMEVQVSVLKQDLETAHQRAHAVQANYERQVILQSETIQELTKTSQALGLVQEEASALRKTVDAYKSENTELKDKWVTEKLELEKSKNEAEKKYDELNDQNKVLLSQLEALHIKLAEKEHNATDIDHASTSGDSHSDGGLRSVISYLRRSREIAETEISLLKQEKLRLQSQLERALKAAETATASLSAERVNSRTMFTDDEFNALKLQVSEINLLRESNMQLREENRHNFEECQKLREVAQIAKVEAEKLQNILRERELEVDGLRKEVQLHKKEKEDLKRRTSEMIEASKNVNLEDSKLLRSELEDLQASVREKEAIIEDLRKQISQKQEMLEKLEQDSKRTSLELTEKDSHLAQVESLKSEVDRQKKLIINHRRRADIFSREKDILHKEKESLSSEKEGLAKEKEVLLKEKEDLKEVLGKEKDALFKEKEVLLMEKEDLNKEKQAISKQLDDLRLENKATGNTPVELAMREKEKLKDARIQILENTLGKHRKEKEKRQSIEKLILAKVESVEMEKKKFEDELERQKEAVRKVSNELEKLKHAKDSLPEETSMTNLFSGNNLDDVASAYALAVKDFETEAHLVLNEVGNQGSASNSSDMDATPVIASTVQASTVDIPVTSLTTQPTTISLPTKSNEERERQVSSIKPRKLVRPRLSKPGEPRQNFGSKITRNPGSVQEMAIQSSIPVSSELPSRKRSASPSPSELLEEQLQPGDSSTDFPEPYSKKSKGLDSLHDETHTQTAVPEKVETIPTVEELLDAVSDVPQGLANEAFDLEKDAENVEDLGNEVADSQQPNDTNTVDMDRDNTDNAEYAGKAIEAEQMVDEAFDLQAEQEGQNLMTDINDGEREMLPENCDLDVEDDTITRSQDATDVHPEHSITAPMPSPSRVDDEPLPLDVIEAPSPEISNANENMEDGELPEDVVKDSDKSNFSDEQTSMEPAVSGENSPNVVSGQVPEQPPQASTNINILERARERQAARMRRASLASSSPGTPTPTSTPSRGRGRPPLRNRGRRGAHQG